MHDQSVELFSEGRSLGLSDQLVGLCIGDLLVYGMDSVTVGLLFDGRVD